MLVTNAEQTADWKKSFDLISDKELAELAKDHDFAIIPADLIDRIRMSERWVRMELHMPTDERPYIQFVNSDYFVAGWGKEKE